MNDEQYMQVALSLAENTIGQTSPNPSVGSVVVKDGRIIGLGAHLKAGEPHAEVHAINMAGENAEGSTIYVTLEPCSHFGKTPPCAQLLIDSKVKKVVVGSVDPNPKVSGRGIKMLREAGIEVNVGVLKDESEKINPFFNYFMQTGLPFVTLKSAISIDGKIATTTGESKWITSSEAREDVHHYRHTHDAILVGVNTVIADNPSLTTRLKSGGIHPIRIILDTNLRTPISSKVVQDQQAKTIIVTGKDVGKEKIDEFERYGVEVISMPTRSVEIIPLLQMLGERQVLSLFVEGGSKINDSFLRSKAFQQVVTYIAPKIIGGHNAPSSFSGEGIPSLSNVPSLKIESIVQIGPDIKIVAKNEGAYPCLQG